MFFIIKCLEASKNLKIMRFVKFLKLNSKLELRVPVEVGTEGKP